MRGVTYRCPHVVAPRSRCSPSPKWIAELTRVAHMIATTQGPGYEKAPASYCAWAGRILAKAAKAQVSSLTNVERIVAQTAAMKLFAGPDCHRQRLPRKAAASVAIRLALSARVLRAMGSTPAPGIDRWIGPRAAWIDKRTRIPLHHDSEEGFVKAFRPVQSGNRRAIFGQVVAFDSSWGVHLTPIVSRIELRMGTEPGASACVLALDTSRLRCASDLMRPLSLADTPPAKLGRGFLRRSHIRGRAGCDMCHGPNAAKNGVSKQHPFFGDLPVLPTADVAAHLKLRFDAVLKGAKNTAARAAKLAPARVTTP